MLPDIYAVTCISELGIGNVSGLVDVSLVEEKFVRVCEFGIHGIITNKKNIVVMFFFWWHFFLAVSVH